MFHIVVNQNYRNPDGPDDEDEKRQGHSDGPVDPKTAADDLLVAHIPLEEGGCKERLEKC